jgi:signal transduction histidine kinase
MDGMWRLISRQQSLEALRIAHDELEHRVAERTAELKATNEQLQQEIAEHERADAERENLIRELDAFAHTVAHDLKNPINLIVGFADALLQDFPTLPEAEIRDYLHTIGWSGRKMSNIINELLLLAGIRGREEVEIVPLDMDHVVNEVLQRLAYMTRDMHSEIVRPSRWPSAVGYPPWVEEVWANYISNGLKYGGHPPRLELGADTLPDGMVRFWVRDNGPGIPPEDQGRLFTPFTQLDQVRAKGHGLGLSIVQRIVERLGGQVGVESVVGQGSVFSFTLPAAGKNNTGQLTP